jgi:signal transduction histidine kinase
MEAKKISEQVDISKVCHKYGLPLWQCPHFLFLVMGLVTMVVVVVSYILGIHYIENPQTISLAILILTAFLFVITFVITKSFERTAEANRLKTEFVGIVTHQLRSPLTSLRWAIESLVSGEFGQVEEKQLEYLKILQENNKRMGELVDNLITVSKLEDKKNTIKKDRISLTNLIKDSIFKFQPLIQSKEIEIKFNPKEELIEIFSELSQIKLILENLIDNAIRYTPSQKSAVPLMEKKKINIGLSKKGGNVYFEIEDEGIGISREDQKYIFQNFFRAGNVKEAQPYGTGLGLFIVKKIINNLGGKIGFRSEEGKGSTFWFILPL